MITIARGEFNKTLAFVTVYRIVLEMQSLSLNYFVDMKIFFLPPDWMTCSMFRYVTTSIGIDQLERDINWLYKQKNHGTVIVSKVIISFLFAN